MKKKIYIFSKPFILIEIINVLCLKKKKKTPCSYKAEVSRSENVHR